MGEHLSHEQSVKIANKTILILAAITIFEVLFALFGKGYIVSGVHFPAVLMGGMMIILSIVKAYLIIYEFMHMKYEVPALVKTVLFPLVLLVWAIIAFSMEGNYWKESRDKTSDKTEKVIEFKESNNDHSHDHKGHDKHH